MKNGQVRVVSAPVDNRRRRFIYLLPLFLAAVVIGFLIQFSFYEVINFGGIRQAIVSLPTKWNQINFLETFDESSTVDSDESLEEQPENETVIIELSEQVSTPTTMETKLNLWEEPSEQISTPITIQRQLEMWKEPTLLKINFTWLSNNEDICKLNASDSKDLRIMPILVHTARHHFGERLAIRRSWGSLPIYRNWDIRFVFLMGEADRGLKPERNKDKFGDQEKRLKDEQAEFGDLVIGSFTDTYHNLTYKHLMGYKWILNFCRDATFVLKIDDDIFIDIMRWLDWRSDDLDIIAKNKDAKIPDLYCHTMAGTQPLRDVGNKWYASPEDWPDPNYPDYCSGCAYALTVDLIQKIYLSSNDIKVFWIDDVFVTGALMDVAKKRFDIKPEYKHLWGEVTMDFHIYLQMCKDGSFDDKREFGAISFVYRGDLFERDMMCLWNKTLHDSNTNPLLQVFHRLF